MYDNFRQKTLPFLIGIALVLLVVGGAVFVQLFEPEFDPVTYCRNDRAAQTLILVDQTDVITDRPLGGVVSVVGQVAESLADGERLVIYELRENSDWEQRILLDICRPPSTNWFWEAPTESAKQLEDFRRKVHKVMDGLTKVDKSPYSPILETINALFDAENSWGRTRFVLISDLLQFSPRCKQGIDRIALEKEPSCPDMSPNAKADFEVYYIPRQGKWARVQTQAHREWWLNRLRSSGGTAKIVRDVY